MSGTEDVRGKSDDALAKFEQMKDNLTNGTKTKSVRYKYIHHAARKKTCTWSK